MSETWPGTPVEAEAWPGSAVAPATGAQSFLMGLTDPIQGGAQLAVNALPSGVVGAVNDATAFINRQPVIGPVTRALGMVPATREQINEQTRRREAEHQAARQAAGATGTDWWRMGGQVVAGLPVGAAMPAATLPGAVASGAAQGAILGALQPVTEGDVVETSIGQALFGTAAGAVGGAAGHALGRLIAPRADPAAVMLRREGTELTPGQAAGGMARRIEDKLISVPVVGDRIAAAQRRSIESFNRTVANRVLQPIGQRVGRSAPVGRELVADVGERISRAYDDAFAQARPFGPDRQFQADIARVSRMFLTPEMRERFRREVTDNIISRFQGGPIDGQTFKTIDSELGALVRRFSPGGAAERELADALAAVQKAMRDLLARSNPRVAPRIRAADEAFARFVRMQSAAGSADAVGGVFTPRQLSGAVRNADRSTRRGAYARGDALLQDLSDAARNVLPQTVPNSGTTDRALMALLAAGAGTGAVPLPALAAGAGAYGAYSRPGVNALSRLLAREPSAAARLSGGALARAGAPVAVPLGALMLSPPPRSP